MGMAHQMPAIGSEQVIVSTKTATGPMLDSVGIERAVAAMTLDGAAVCECLEALFDDASVQPGIGDHGATRCHDAIMCQNQSKRDGYNIAGFKFVTPGLCHLFSRHLFMVSIVFLVKDEQVTRLAFQLAAQRFQC